MKAEKGSKVKVHYTGTLEDGTQFDSSRGREPLAFEVGAGQMIKGFDSAVDGMQVGDVKNISIAPAEGYGEKSDQLIYRFPKEQLPPDMNPEVGNQLALSGENGQQIPVVVIEITETEIVLDANHELAGQTLKFEIEMMEIA